MKDKLRNQRIKKYGLMALAIIVIVSVIFGTKISGKDTTIKDGQGNEFISTSIESTNTDSEAITSTFTDVSLSTDSDSVSTPSDASDTNTAKATSTSIAEKKTEKADSNTKEKPKDAKPEEKKDTKKETPKEAKVDNSEDFTASNDGNISLKPDEPQPVSVTIQIRCDTLSNDMSKLQDEALKDYVPEDGVILAETIYNGTTDNTVYDALVYVCRNLDIQFEASYTPLFTSYYIEGINYLYEFDGGPQSGWMFSVNDWFPNYGCSSYYLSDGDSIKWLYTCEGLGKDVGAEGWN